MVQLLMCSTTGLAVLAAFVCVEGSVGDVGTPCPCGDDLSMRCDSTSNLCVCTEGFYHYHDNNSCIAAYGSQCLNTSQCLVRNLNNTVCVQARCQCAIGFFYPGGRYRTQCFEAYRSTCVTSDACENLLLHSFCFEGFCTCRHGYYYHNSTTGCVPVNSLPCIGTADCTRKGGKSYICSNSRTCACADNFYLYANVCVPVVGSNCTSHRECQSRGKGQHLCGSNVPRKCFDPCAEVNCHNGGSCVIDGQTTPRGYRCMCRQPYAGVHCAYTEEAVVVTKLLLDSEDIIASKSFFKWARNSLLHAFCFASCGTNSTCRVWVQGRVIIELISSRRVESSVALTYIVLWQGSPMTATDVVRNLTSVSPTALGQRIGRTVHLAASGIVAAPPAKHCLLKWAFRLRPNTVYVTSMFLRSLELRLGTFLYQLITSKASPALCSDISCKIVNHSVTSGVLSITFAVFNDAVCLPALSVSRLIRNVSSERITPSLGIIPVSSPTEALTPLYPLACYRNAFIIRTRMSGSKNDAYFALSWLRLERSLSRVVEMAYKQYVRKIGYKLARGKRRAYPEVSCRLLDIRREKDGVNVEAYAQSSEVVIPIEHILEYLNNVPAEDIAVELEEPVPERAYIIASDNEYLASLQSAGEGGTCLENDSHVNTIRYWARTVLKIDAEKDVTSSIFQRKKRVLLSKLFASGLTKKMDVDGRFSSRLDSSSSICVQMVEVRRISYDRGDTELVYFVTRDGLPITPVTLADWVGQLPIQTVALILNDIVVEPHVVEPHGRSLRSGQASATAGQQFIVAFSENYVEADWPDSLNYSLRLYFTTCAPTNAHVTVEAPKHKSHYKVSLKVRPNTENYLVIPRVFEMRGTTISPNVLLVNSNQPINVVAVNRDYLSHDATLVYPLERLGTDYSAVSVTSDGSQSQLMVAAHVDSTVQVHLPLQSNGELYTVLLNGKEYAGSVSISLSAMEVLQIQATGDISGARVTSNKPVAVFTGNVAASISGLSRDHLYEQLLPTPELATGTSFVAGVAFVDRERQADMLKIVATRPNTLLSIPSRNKTVHMEDVGDVESVPLTGRDYSLYLHSNVPVKVFHLSLSATKQFGDPSLLEVAPLHLQANYYVFTLPDGGYRNFLHSVVLVIEEDSRDGLRINKGPLQTTRYDWHTVPDTSPVMVVTSLQLHPGVYRIWHVDLHVTLSASVFGMSIKESYSLSAGSCPADFISHFLPTSTSTQATTITSATTPQARVMRRSKKVEWPIATSKGRQLPSTTAKPFVWMSRRNSLVASTTMPSLSNEQTPLAVQRASATNVTFTRATVKRAPATERGAPVIDVISTPPSTSLAATVATIAIPSTAITTNRTTHTTTSTPTTSIPSTSLTVDGNTSAVSSVAAAAEAIIPNETYWLLLGLGEENRPLADEERKKIEDTIVNLYISNKQARLKRSDDFSPHVQARVFLLETHGYYTAVVFYILEDGQPITAVEALDQIEYKPVDELTHLLGIYVVKPITAYVDTLTTTAVFEAAILDREEESGDKVTLIAILVAVVGVLVAIALTVGLTVRTRRKNQAKQAARKKKEQQKQADSKIKGKVGINSGQGFITPAVDEYGDGAARARESLVTFEQEDTPAEGVGQEVKHGDGAQNTTATELLTDTAGAGGGNGLEPLQPEYPMSLNTAELDSVFAPHVANAATRVEIFKNKSLMRKKGQGRLSSRRKGASEPDVGYQNFIRRVSSDVHRRRSTQQEAHQPSVHQTDQSKKRSTYDRAQDFPEVHNNTENSESDEVQGQVEVVDADVVGLSNGDDKNQAVVLDPSSHSVLPSKSSLRMNFATRSEIFKNKSLMRHRGRLVAMGRLASEPEIGQSFTRVSSGTNKHRRRTTQEVEQFPVHSADQSGRNTTISQPSGSYDLPIAIEKSSDDVVSGVQGESKAAMLYDVDDESEAITSGRNEGAVMSSTLAQMESTIDHDLLVKQAIADNKLRKYRLRQRYRKEPQLHSRVPEHFQSVHSSINDHLLESASTNSLPGSVAVDSDGTASHRDDEMCKDWRGILLRKSKRRQRRHMQEMTSNVCLRSAGSRSSLT